MKRGAVSVTQSTGLSWSHRNSWAIVVLLEGVIEDELEQRSAALQRSDDQVISVQDESRAQHADRRVVEPAASRSPRASSDDSD